MIINKCNTILIFQNRNCHKKYNLRIKEKVDFYCSISVKCRESDHEIFSCFKARPKVDI